MPVKLFIILLACCFATGKDMVAQWQILDTDFDDYCYSLHFTSEDTGYVAAGSSIKKTTDGGLTWQSYDINDGNSTYFYAMFFSSPSIGYVAGQTVYKTTNAGATWDSMYTISEHSNGVHCMAFTSDSHGFIGASDLPRITTDGGSTWEKLRFALVPQEQMDVKFLNDSLGFTCGYSRNFGGEVGMVTKTTDAGASWSRPIELDSVFWGFALRTIDFISPLKGWAAGSRSGTTIPKLMTTMDGGETWSTMPTGLEDGIRRIRFVDAYVGFILDTRGTIFSTLDGGLTWNQNTAYTEGKKPYELFIVGTTVYAVGEYGLVMKRSVPTSIQNEIVGIARLSIFPNPSHGSVRVVVGAYSFDGTTNYISVVNALGLEVFQTSMTSSEVTLDLSPLPRGVYFVQVSSSQSMQTSVLVLH